LRKALFAIVLVAASFAGGAVVNGPGLRWAQAMILDRLAGDRGEDAGPDDAAQAQEDAIPLEPIPANPVPPLALGTDEGAASKGKSQGKDEGKGKAPASSAKEPARDPATATATATAAAAAESAVAAPLPPLGSLADGTAGSEPKEPAAPAVPESKEDDRGDEPAAAAGPRNDAQIRLAKAPGAENSGPEPLELMPSPLPVPSDTRADPARDQAQTPTRAPAQNPAPTPAPASAPAQAENWPDAPGSAPAAAVPPRPFEPSRSGSASAEAGTAPAPASEASTPSPSPSLSPASSTGWTEIRRRMSALGVSRYRIEGEPGGRVRFFCIIPLAGRRAVAQHFEAEGDDELEAAETALRRVDLWRATENPAPTP
jgi:hypothetical protein